MKRSELHSDPEVRRAFVARGQRASAAAAVARRRPISPASPEQREKVRDRICVNCGARGCDPAHLTPRSMRGCDSADCVLPLCRTCHRAFDDGLLDLEPVLALVQFVAERVHMAGHLTFEQCRLRLRGRAA